MSHSGSGETGTTGSIEISVPTDLTVTSEGEGEDRRLPSLKRRAQEIHGLTSEKNHFQKLTEKLQLEIKGKESQLMTCKAQFTATLNQNNIQNEMKLSEKQALINRIEAELLSTCDELRLLKERAGKELANLLQKCFELQQNQSRLIVKQDEIKFSLSNLILSDVEFDRIRNISRDQLPLQQFVSLRVYEMTMPLKTKVKELEAARSSLESVVVSREKEVDIKNTEITKLTDELNILRERVVGYSSKCEELRNDMRLYDYRVHNFDRVKRERDKYEEEREELLREKSELEASTSLLKREKAILEERSNDLKGRLRQQEQDLSKYKAEYFDTKTQLDKGNEDNQKTSSRLRLEQERSEEFHEKFLKARTEIISLSGSLQDAQNEIKTLKQSYMESSKTEKETKEQLNKFQSQYHKLQNEMDLLVLKYHKEKDLLKLEVSELKGNYNALLKTYNDSLDNSAKLLKENQYYQSYSQDDRIYKEREILKLKQEVSSLMRELKQYKSVEDDYMSTLKVFASVADKDDETPDICLPPSSIIRGKLSEQVLSLTRRILFLERQNVEACSIIQKLTGSLDQMRSKLYAFKSAIGMAGKPSEQFLEKIRLQEEQILALQEALRASNESKAIILRDNNNLESDLKNANSYLERSLPQEEEISNLKKAVTDLKTLILQNISKQRKGNIPTAIKITKGS